MGGLGDNIRAAGLLVERGGLHEPDAVGGDGKRGGEGAGLEVRRVGRGRCGRLAVVQQQCVDARGLGLPGPAEHSV
ncbi:hypothetical protein [Streptomyces sp. NPDC047097]|uniref:hypothetical protein n=1 Tax=Streptomyces sp. NPDC047097 TaxID=3155260 RepID=UPI003408F493